MKNLVKAGAVLAAFSLVALSSSAAQADPNLIVNGGFETGDFTGWTVDAGFTFVTTGPFDGFLPHSGDFFAALGDTSDDGGTLSQTFATVPGGSYTLTYFLGSDGATPNFFTTQTGVMVLFNQVNIPAQPYTEYSFNFTAPGNMTTLTFTEQNLPAYLALDDVSVTPGVSDVPEPGAIAFGVIAAGSVLGMVARKRRKS